MNKYIVLPGGIIQPLHSEAEQQAPGSIDLEALMEWGEWCEQSYGKSFEDGGRIVGNDYLPGDIRVSTVFLGLDHQYGNGPPVLFETMIFGGEHDQYQDRYCTIEEARAGHRAALAKAQGEEST